MEACRPWLRSWAHGARSWSRCFTGAEMIDLNAELQRIDRAREETHKRGEESRKFAGEMSKPDRWYPRLTIVSCAVAALIAALVAHLR